MAAFFEGCRVQSCCGYWSIRTGTLIIGIIFMISTILALSKYIVTMIIIETHWQFCQQKANKDDSDELAENQEFPVPGLENLTLMKCKDFHRIVSYRLLFYVGIMMYTVQLILTSLMIHGAKNGKPKMMSPWLLWTLMYISYGILNMVFSRHVGGSGFVQMFISVGIPFYFFLIVNSYHLQLREIGSQSVVSVLAVTRPNQEMHVILPSVPVHHKDDPPPPYSSFVPDSDPPPYTPYPNNGAVARSPSPSATAIEIQPSSSSSAAGRELYGATGSIPSPSEPQPVVPKPALPPA
ncbi:uncharacterized protein LOC143020281 isoform X1 [Oratosquilla oratoria]|uniref:uncharacterized protein LOC143020281 isoform X1 n=1 Tax=Oratosquilla oratoria TaxID=337810 RepID=UPI003F7627DD